MRRDLQAKVGVTEMRTRGQGTSPGSSARGCYAEPPLLNGGFS
jgi:hypothetical protein